MNRDPVRLRLIVLGISILVMLAFARVAQNPEWYFDTVATICFTIAVLYLVEAISTQIYLWSQVKSKAKKKKSTPSSQPEPDSIFTDDGEITEFMDDAKPKRDQL